MGEQVQRDPVTNKIIHLDLEELKGKNIYRAYSWYDVYYQYLIIKEALKNDKN